MRESMDAELMTFYNSETAESVLRAVCKGLREKAAMLENALLWVIYEQCTYGGKAYAKLLIHGEEAFRVLELQDECDEAEIAERLFGKGGET